MRKTFKLGKGLKLTLSGSGLSMTLGGRGNSVHFGNKGVYRNISIPGVGSSRRKISGENNYDDEDYTVTPVVAPPQAPASGSGSFSQMNAVALKIEAEKKSASAVPATPEIKTDKKPSKFLKFLKYIVCCPMLFISIVCLLGAITRPNNTGKEWLCFPVAFFIAGCLVANTAKRKNLNGSAIKYFLYGALIPVVSWIDVTMINAQSKAKGFMKGLAFSIIGIAIFLAVFVNFLPPVKAKEPAKNSVSEIVKPENKTVEVPAPVKISAVPEIKIQATEAQELQESDTDTESEAEEREGQAEIKKQEQEYLKQANTVVITSRGKKYHSPDCNTIKGKTRKLTIAQALKRGYKPCGVCEPPSSPVTVAPNLDFEVYGN